MSGLIHLWLYFINILYKYSLRDSRYMRGKNPLHLHVFLLCNTLLRMQADNSRDNSKEV